ncbi:MAG: hypothetical protein KatS3mg104_3197 [Phycisphaerae bacterium]|nr:MAG: hypothetical protein KatS3mg104_3197 [Phycisphaerae bacterium]
MTIPRLRKIYISGTMFALCVLSAAAGVIVWQAEWLFTRWFGDSLPMTREILPWILIHTIIGASALPARAVMLGMGHFKAYAISALVGGSIQFYPCSDFSTHDILGYPFGDLCDDSDRRHSLSDLDAHLCPDHNRPESRQKFPTIPAGKVVITVTGRSRQGSSDYGPIYRLLISA